MGELVPRGGCLVLVVLSVAAVVLAVDVTVWVLS